MKTVALVALIVGMAAAAAGILLQTIKIHKAGKSDKWLIGTILFAVGFIVIAVLNIIFVIPML